MTRTRALAAAILIAAMLPLAAMPLGADDDDPRLPESGDDDYGATPEVLLDALDDTSLVDFFGTEVWNAFVDQVAYDVIEVADLHAQATGAGVVVAVIDTGIDPEHPILSGSLVPGYDFTRDLAGYGSEWLDLEPLVASELQGSELDLLFPEVVELNQSVSWILDQSVSWILDTASFPPAFGHGTMVSGIVHLVAPDALIMPLKAFTADGVATTEDIVEAIYFAIDNGADVINMSFSATILAPEIEQAVVDAVKAGVPCIAAAGNAGIKELAYPAALDFAIGVGSTDESDGRSPFSSFGNKLVTLAAPGEAVFTTFPGGGSYAAGWGTSFATPLVSGAAALALEGLGGADARTRYGAVMDVVLQSEPLPGLGLGHGRLLLETEKN